MRNTRSFKWVEIKEKKKKKNSQNREEFVDMFQYRTGLYPCLQENDMSF